MKERYAHSSFTSPSAAPLHHHLRQDEQYGFSSASGDPAAVPASAAHVSVAPSKSEMQLKRSSWSAFPQPFLHGSRCQEAEALDDLLERSQSLEKLQREASQSTENLKRSKKKTGFGSIKLTPSFLRNSTSSIRELFTGRSSKTDTAGTKTDGVGPPVPLQQPLSDGSRRHSVGNYRQAVAASSAAAIRVRQPSTNLPTRQQLQQQHQCGYCPEGTPSHVSPQPPVRELHTAKRDFLYRFSSVGDAASPVRVAGPCEVCGCDVSLHSTLGCRQVRGSNIEMTTRRWGEIVGESGGPASVVVRRRSESSGSVVPSSGGVRRWQDVDGSGDGGGSCRNSGVFTVPEEDEGEAALEGVARRCRVSSTYENVPVPVVGYSRGGSEAKTASAARILFAHPKLESSGRQYKHLPEDDVSASAWVQRGLAQLKTSYHLTQSTSARLVSGDGRCYSNVTDGTTAGNYHGSVVRGDTAFSGGRCSQVLPLDESRSRLTVDISGRNNGTSQSSHRNTQGSSVYPHNASVSPCYCPSGGLLGLPQGSSCITQSIHPDAIGSRPNITQSFRSNSMGFCPNIPQSPNPDTSCLSTNVPQSLRPDMMSYATAVSPSLYHGSVPQLLGRDRSYTVAVGDRDAQYHHRHQRRQAAVTNVDDFGSSSFRQLETSLEYANRCFRDNSNGSGDELSSTSHASLKRTTPRTGKENKVPADPAKGGTTSKFKQNFRFVNSKLFSKKFVTKQKLVKNSKGKKSPTKRVLKGNNSKVFTSTSPKFKYLNKRGLDASVAAGCGLVDEGSSSSDEGSIAFFFNDMKRRSVPHSTAERSPIKPLKFFRGPLRSSTKSTSYSVRSDASDSSSLHHQSVVSSPTTLDTSFSYMAFSRRRMHPLTSSSRSAQSAPAYPASPLEGAAACVEELGHDGEKNEHCQDCAATGGEAHKFAGDGGDDPTERISPNATESFNADHSLDEVVTIEMQGPPPGNCLRGDDSIDLAKPAGKLAVAATKSHLSLRKYNKKKRAKKNRRQAAHRKHQQGMSDKVKGGLKSSLSDCHSTSDCDDDIDMRTSRDARNNEGIVAIVSGTEAGIFGATSSVSGALSSVADVSGTEAGIPGHVAGVSGPLVGISGSATGTSGATAGISGTKTCVSVTTADHFTVTTNSLVHHYTGEMQCDDCCTCQSGARSYTHPPSLHHHGRRRNTQVPSLLFNSTPSMPSQCCDHRQHHQHTHHSSSGCDHASSTVTSSQDAGETVSSTRSCSLHLAAPGCLNPSRSGPYRLPHRLQLSPVPASPSPSIATYASPSVFRDVAYLPEEEVGLGDDYVLPLDKHTATHFNFNNDSRPVTCELESPMYVNPVEFGLEGIEVEGSLETHAEGSVMKDEGVTEKIETEERMLTDALCGSVRSMSLTTSNCSNERKTNDNASPSILTHSHGMSQSPVILPNARLFSVAGDRSFIDSGNLDLPLTAVLDYHQRSVSCQSVNQSVSSGQSAVPSVGGGSTSKTVSPMSLSHSPSDGSHRKRSSSRSTRMKDALIESYNRISDACGAEPYYENFGGNGFEGAHVGESGNYENLPRVEAKSAGKTPERKHDSLPYCSVQNKASEHELLKGVPNLQRPIDRTLYSFFPMADPSNFPSGNRISSDDLSDYCFNIQEELRKEIKGTASKQTAASEGVAASDRTGSLDVHCGRRKSSESPGRSSLKHDSVSTLCQQDAPAVPGTDRRQSAAGTSASTAAGTVRKQSTQHIFEAQLEAQLEADFCQGAETDSRRGDRRSAELSDDQGLDESVAEAVQVSPPWSHSPAHSYQRPHTAASDPPPLPPSLPREVLDSVRRVAQSSPQTPHGCGPPQSPSCRCCVSTQDSHCIENHSSSSCVFSSSLSQLRLANAIDNSTSGSFYHGRRLFQQPLDSSTMKPHSCSDNLEDFDSRSSGNRRKFSACDSPRAGRQHPPLLESVSCSGPPPLYRCSPSCSPTPSRPHHHLGARTSAVEEGRSSSASSAPRVFSSSYSCSSTLTCDGERTGKVCSNTVGWVQGRHSPAAPPTPDSPLDAGELVTRLAAVTEEALRSEKMAHLRRDMTDLRAGDRILLSQLLCVYSGLRQLTRGVSTPPAPPPCLRGDTVTLSSPSTSSVGSHDGSCIGEAPSTRDRRRRASLDFLPGMVVCNGVQTSAPSSGGSTSRRGEDVSGGGVKFYLECPEEDSSSRWSVDTCERFTKSPSDSQPVTPFPSPENFPSTYPPPRCASSHLPPSSSSPLVSSTGNSSSFIPSLSVPSFTPAAGPHFPACPMHLRERVVTSLLQQQRSDGDQQDGSGMVTVL